MTIGNILNEIKKNPGAVGQLSEFVKRVVNVLQEKKDLAQTTGQGSLMNLGGFMEEVLGTKPSVMGPASPPVEQVQEWAKKVWVRDFKV